MAPPPASRAPRIERPPSMVELATRALVRMMLAGELVPGDRVVENRLTQEMGISRPPLREAMRVLEQQGLLTQERGRGAYVTDLTLHDVYEIFTLRGEYERIAVELGVPVADPARLDRCRRALAALDGAAASGDQVAMLERAFDFHASVIGLSGHRRLEESYRALQMQMLLCMAKNREARADIETLRQDAARHHRLLDTIASGDRQAVLRELTHHGDRTFLADIEHRVPGHTPESLAWLRRVRAERRPA